MLTPNQAKSRLYKLLAIFSALILWPALAVLLTAILSVIEFDQMLLLILTLTVILLGLLVWFVVELWRSAKDVNVLPWASLWIFVPFYGLFIVAMLFLEPLKYLADNKPKQEQLPPTWELIKNSFAHYFKYFNTLIKPALYFLYVSLAMGIFAALTQFKPIFGALYAIIALASVIATIWITITVFHAVIQTQKGSTDLTGSYQFTKKKFGPYLLITVLIILITAIPFALVILGILGSILGISIGSGLPGLDKDATINSLTGILPLIAFAGILATTMFIASWVWMIYKSIQYSQSIMLLLDAGKTGMEALRESARLIKNRWWGVVWKNQMWGLIVMAITLSVSLFLGGSTVLMLFLFQDHAIGQALNGLFSSIMQGLIRTFLMPLALIFSYKLYLALKNTRV